ncbi:MAG TPA: hypothetical protein VLS90_20435, partial [Thermodesulfobacteriota bacterium]|nr:hypothetical protein [Thermodesulfobacteriota bacterium]
VKSPGNGWIIVRTSTPDAQLPAPGTRINPARDKALLATIQSSGWNNYYTAPANRKWVEPCWGSWQFWAFELGGNGPGFDVHQCDDASKTWKPVGYTSGTAVPASCASGQWFFKTNETDDTRKAWYCIENKFYNMAFTYGMMGYSHSGIEIEEGASRYRFVGLEVTHTNTPSYGYRSMIYWTLINVDPKSSHIIFDRMYVHGRGAPSKVNQAFVLDGSHQAIVDSVIDDITQWKKGEDVDTESVAIKSDFGPGPIAILNNFISTIGISFYTSDEADFRAPDPADYEIRGNYFYKSSRYIVGHPEWNGYHYDNRHHVELKRGRRYVFDGNIFEGNFGTLQQGAAFSLSNSAGYQANDKNDNTVRDILVTSNIFRNNPVSVIIGGVLRGRVGLNPVVMQRVRISNNLFESVDGYRYANPGWAGSGAAGNVLSIFNGEDIAVTNNTIYRVKGTSPHVLVFNQAANPPEPFPDPGANFIFRNNISVFANGGVCAQCLGGTKGLYMSWQRIPDPGYFYDHNVFIGPFNTTPNNRPADYPDGNFWEESESGVGWTNPSAGDFSLLGNSRYKGKGGDGRDPGIDAALLKAATANTAGGYTPGPSPVTKPNAPSSLRVE